MCYFPKCIIYFVTYIFNVKYFKWRKHNKFFHDFILLITSVLAYFGKVRRDVIDQVVSSFHRLLFLMQVGFVRVLSARHLNYIWRHTTGLIIEARWSIREINGHVVWRHQSSKKQSAYLSNEVQIWNTLHQMLTCCWPVTKYRHCASELNSFPLVSTAWTHAFLPVHCRRDVSNGHRQSKLRHLRRYWQWHRILISYGSGLSICKAAPHSKRHKRCQPEFISPSSPRWCSG